jgi:hypothetical protein
MYRWSFGTYRWAAGTQKRPPNQGSALLNRPSAIRFHFLRKHFVSLP